MGELASIAAMVEGSLLASEYYCIIDKNGVARPNPRFLYGVVGLQDYLYPTVVKILRELAGGGVLQVPSILLRSCLILNRKMSFPAMSFARGETEEKIKLFKLAWDVIGSGIRRSSSSV